MQHWGDETQTGKRSISSCTGRLKRTWLSPSRWNERVELNSLLFFSCVYAQLNSLNYHFHWHANSPVIYHQSPLFKWCYQNLILFWIRLLWHGAGLTNTSHLLTSFLFEYCGLLTRFIISSQARGVPQGGLNEAEEINPFIQQIFTVLE